MKNVPFVFVFFSAFPTFVTALYFPEGNILRLSGFALLLTACLFSFRSRLICTSIEIARKNKTFLLFCLLTVCISVCHALVEGYSTSINYVDYAIPLSILALFYFSLQKNAIDAIHKTIKAVLLAWILIGVLELWVQIIDQDFLYDNFYYPQWTVNNLLAIQNELGLDLISLQSLGLNTQQFGVVIGLSAIYFVQRSRGFSERLLVVLMASLLHVFSFSFTILVAELAAFIYFILKNIKLRHQIYWLVVAVLFFFIAIYSSEWRVLAEPGVYFNELLVWPLEFFLELPLHEQLFGLNETVAYPGENRIFVLLLRFGSIWFVTLSVLFGIYLTKLYIRGKSDRDSNNLFVIVVFIALAGVHNALWMTFSGQLLCAIVVAWGCLENKKGYVVRPLFREHVSLKINYDIEAKDIRKEQRFTDRNTGLESTESAL